MSTYDRSELGRSQDVAGIEDRIVDEFFEGDFDWVDVVRRYPIPTLLISALGGFLLGRLHGTEVFTAASDRMAEKIQRSLGEF
jgi:hypothetical protein